MYVLPSAASIDVVPPTHVVGMAHVSIQVGRCNWCSASVQFYIL